MLYCHCAALLFIIKTEKSTVSYFSGGGKYKFPGGISRRMARKGLSTGHIAVKM